MKTLISAVLVAVGSVVVAAPAHADAAEYLQMLDDKYTYLSTQQLLTEGYKICAVLNQGTTSTPVVEMVQKDLGGVSVAVAEDVVGSAAVGLGC
jgi:hypothetical protein